jgi:hypothetical protein
LPCFYLLVRYGGFNLPLCHEDGNFIPLHENFEFHALLDIITVTAEKEQKLFQAPFRLFCVSVSKRKNEAKAL